MGTLGLEAGDVKRTLGRMAHEVLENNKGPDNLVVVGVLNSGFPVAKRLAFVMTQIEGTTIPCGSLDIRSFRDDRADGDEAQDQSEIPFAVTGKRVILVDEVLQTGRTVRAAMDALMRHGRPERIQLAVLIDRGGRELPIEANYVGRKLEVADDEYVQVLLGVEDEVRVTKGEAGCSS
ncbi:MAG: bifunctional pyr operon transcriptional regulator/uracil phosphoribosyltransferase PyrR [Armatimonadetes bacterium]|nr:bifunctional pyr operon transcriptional regulator/uracil phosphoribosyltransferase PyrR [Armatimonadota bacterium]